MDNHDQTEFFIVMKKISEKSENLIKNKLYLKMYIKHCQILNQ